MTDDRMNAICARLPERAGARFLLALAGPPATGKSTVAEAVVARLLSEGRRAALVPMDGFHLDNRILEARGLLSRKGAPETFDAEGFLTLIQRLKAGVDVVVPVFDRSRDIAIAGASVVPADIEIVVAEGNYLMFDEAPWRGLAEFWDLAVFLDASEDVLRDRLVARWRVYGLDPAAALTRAEANDLPNARRILDRRLPGALTL